MSKTYIEFKIVDKKPKTNVYNVRNINSDIIIGFIKWYNSWRQYCFFPIHSTVYSRGCMKDIIDFINKITKKRKKS